MIYLNKALLGVLIGSIIMISSLLSANVIEEEAFTFVDYEDQIDVFPGNQSWGEFGTFDGTENTTENYLITTADNGSFTSDRFVFNQSIRMSQLITATDNIGSGDNVRFFVEYLNEDGTTIQTQNFTLNQNLNTFALKQDIDKSYSGYRFTVDINQDQKGSPIQVEKITFEYELIEDLSEAVPFDLSDFVLIIPFLLGFVIFLMSFIMLVVGD